MIFHEILLKLCKVFHVNVSIEGDLTFLTDEEFYLLARAKAERRLWFAAGILCVFFCLAGCWTSIHTFAQIPFTSIVALAGGLYFGYQIRECIYWFKYSYEVEDSVWSEH